jgi:hypothetical protein
VDAALEIREREKALDNEHYFKALRAKGEGLIEVLIDFELENDDPRARKQPKTTKRTKEQVHIRILGYGSASDFVLLYGFRKFGGPDYGPACHAAFSRKAGVEKDGRRARPCQFA